MKNPKEFRNQVRRGQWDDQTVGLCPGFVQANLVILPKEYAVDFAAFCIRNPKPCPLLDITSQGDCHTFMAPGADLRTDLPKYHVYKSGKLDEVRTNLLDIWESGFVSFLLGCSHTFEPFLTSSGIPLRYREQGLRLSIYETNIEVIPVGIFTGTVIASMRPIPKEMITRAAVVSARYPRVHGGPLHIGNPELIGVDLDSTYVGDKPQFSPGDIPVFWACGVTPQHIALTAGIPYMITHAPGHMFVTDISVDDLGE